MPTIIKPKRILSEDHKQKISLAHFGKKKGPMSEETKKKIGLGNLGKKRGPMSEEHKEKIRLAKVGKKQSPETIRKRFLWQKGYKHSQQTKDKIGRSNKGENNKTDESKIWRKRVIYKHWRKAVFTRDNWTCQKCFEKGYMHPHHIRNFAEAIELRFDINNGITLCVPCHRKFHKEYGAKNNSLIQIKSFINK